MPSTPHVASPACTWRQVLAFRRNTIQSWCFLVWWTQPLLSVLVQWRVDIPQYSFCHRQRQLGWRGLEKIPARFLLLHCFYGVGWSMFIEFSDNQLISKAMAPCECRWLIPASNVLRVEFFFRSLNFCVSKGYRILYSRAVCNPVMSKAVPSQAFQFSCPAVHR